MTHASRTCRDGLVRWPGLVAAACVLGFALAACSLSSRSLKTPALDYTPELWAGLPASQVSYAREVRPILARRCVICHACYDAPCQLKLGSHEGISRGATPRRVYDGGRLVQGEPARLFVDATTEAEWRQRGFHPVLGEQPAVPQANLANSLLYQFLRLKELRPQPRTGRLPDDLAPAPGSSWTCPAAAGFESYAQREPFRGMPLGFPNLDPSDYRTLVTWIAQGAPNDAAAAASPEALGQIPVWETFLNGAGNKQQLVSRYLFEHLFLAHLHFEGAPAQEFYRLVRSSTPPGAAIREIPTVRPFDNPGRSPFYYRLRPVEEEITVKDHVVYELSPGRLVRFRELFLDPDYSVDSMPGYEMKLATNPLLSGAANPFEVFAAIPAASRYRFMLDDARFFIEGFIRGPVCHGNIALNVIEDQFWIFFLDPAHDVLARNDAQLNNVVGAFRLPAERGNTASLLSIWTDYWREEKVFLRQRAKYFRALKPRSLGDAMELIWDGDEVNPNAALTVFRHGESASVRFGLVGDYPETAWILNYPLFERIHYLLVAGFDVYGNAGHQLLTRLYMDFLRIEGENHFLAFLPASHRKRIRDSWYEGNRAVRDKLMDAPKDWLEMEWLTGYTSDAPQIELYGQLEGHLGSLAGADRINRCNRTRCLSGPGALDHDEIADRFRRAASMSGSPIDILPDVAFLRVRVDDSGTRDRVFTLIRNKAYKNLISIFSSENRRDTARDRLSIVEGIEGSYPNFYFVVGSGELEAFIGGLTGMRDRAALDAFVARYGVRRTHADFWRHTDWFHERALRDDPIRAGIFDLSRYANL